MQGAGAAVEVCAQEAEEKRRKGLFSLHHTQLSRVGVKPTQGARTELRKGEERGNKEESARKTGKGVLEPGGHVGAAVVGSKR